ncbi:MAG: penicillin-binding protein 1A [Legionellales bacterium]|nr:penicillin-binding protein 1A [Legionellales bacterium]
MKYFQILIVNLFRLAMVVFVLGVILVCYCYFYMQYKLPDVAVLKDMHLQVPMKIYTSDGKLIAEFGEKRRIPVELPQIPKLLQEAFLSTEDQRFYEHSGVDFIGLIRAAKQLFLTGRKEQGASTITMQVARNFFLSREKTYSRKFNEILLALRIDHEFSKEKILELYLNKIYLGNRAYGVGAAAKVYYNKTLDQLTLAEMAMIGGLAQAPSANNPVSNPVSAKNRRDHVLKRMYELHYIDKKAYEQAILEPIKARYHGPQIQVEAMYLAEMVRQALFAKYGEDAYTEGFSVYTTVSSKNQTAAIKAVQKGLLAYTIRRAYPYPLPTKNLGNYSPDQKETWIKALRKTSRIGALLPGAVIHSEKQTSQILLANGKIVTISWKGLAWTRRPLQKIFTEGNVVRVWEKSPDEWTLGEVPRAESALVSLNPGNGAILAIIGGYDYYKSKFNRATQGELQPGSSFKPFIYSAALAQGFTLASIVNDAPIVITIPGQKPWRPQNSDRKFYGPMRLRVALMQSRNLVSIRLLEAIGIPNAIDYISRFGFDPKRLPPNLTLALGTAQVTPLELATGYATFANGGYRITPYFIDRIDDLDGKTIYQAHPKIACTACNDIDALSPNLPPPDQIAPQVISPQNAFIINSALQDVIKRGTARRALDMKRSDIAGKTGTTNDKFDAWFSGFNADVITTVWVGFDNPQSLREYGAQAALPIWIDYMSVALKDKPEHTLPEPPGLVYVRIDPRTGQRTAPGSNYGEFEVFRKQYEPQFEPYSDQFNYDNNPSYQEQQTDQHIF